MILQSMWAVANKPDVYAVTLGAPGAEISAASPFAQLKFKTPKRIVDAYIQFRLAPDTSNFVVTINADGSLCATVTVPTGQVTSNAVSIADAEIAADQLIDIAIEQTGVSPDTGIDGVLMIIFAA